MTGRHDERIRALMVELVDDPPPTPPFPGDQPLRPAVPRSRLSQNGPLVGLATLVLVLLLGVVSLIVTGGRDDLADLPPTPERAMELFVDRVNRGDLPGVMDLFAPEATCQIDALTGDIDQDCQDLFGFLIATNAVLSFNDFCPIIEGRLSDGRRVESYSCVVSFRTDIHSALGRSNDQTVALNPKFVFAAGLIEEFWIDNPFTGSRDFDIEFWSYLLSIEADYVNEEGIPIFAPEMVDQFSADAAEFAGQDSQS